jgi:hypothetical protein
LKSASSAQQQQQQQQRYEQCHLSIECDGSLSRVPVSEAAQEHDNIAFGEFDVKFDGEDAVAAEKNVSGEQEQQNHYCIAPGFAKTQRRFTCST